MTFEDCVKLCLANRDMVVEFDRLTGSNLSLAGTGLDVQIDFASGKIREDVRRFTLFVWDTVWCRCKEDRDDDSDVVK